MKQKHAQTFQLCPSVVQHNMHEKLLNVPNKMNIIIVDIKQICLQTQHLLHESSPALPLLFSEHHHC
jgi:hypothetical protein